MKSKHVMTAFALLMLAYQGWRVMDYISSSLTGVPDYVRYLISVAFLAFSELGLIIWLHVAQPNATTDAQESTAYVMVWINFAGSMIIGLADLAKHNTMYVVDLSAVDPILFIAPWVMVLLNIGAYLIYVQNDSEAILAREGRRLKHEETSLEMEARRGAVEKLRSEKDTLVQDLSPYYYNDVKDRVSGRTAARFKKDAGKLETAAGSASSSASSAATPSARKNGHGPAALPPAELHTYNAETALPQAPDGPKNA